jgi:hypothetical protein
MENKEEKNKLRMLLNKFNFLFPFLYFIPSTKYSKIEKIQQIVVDYLSRHIRKFVQSDIIFEIEIRYELVSYLTSVLLVFLIIWWLNFVSNVPQNVIFLKSFINHAFQKDFNYFLNFQNLFNLINVVRTLGIGSSVTLFMLKNDTFRNILILKFGEIWYSVVLLYLKLAKNAPICSQEQIKFLQIAVKMTINMKNKISGITNPIRKKQMQQFSQQLIVDIVKTLHYLQDTNKFNKENKLCQQLIALADQLSKKLD